MDNIIIREIKISDDIKICNIIESELGYLCNAELVKGKINQLNEKREKVFVAVDNDKVVGFIHVEKYDVIYFETMANILGLAVEKGYQRKGLGKELIWSVEKWALENEIYMMRLNSGITRKNAHKFYRHLGYKSDKEQFRFTKKL